LLKREKIRDGGMVQRIFELRQIQQLKIQLHDVFDLMRVHNLSGEEQRACVINSTDARNSAFGIIG